MAMAVGMPASPWLSCSTAGVSMVGVPVLGASAAFAVDSVVRHLEARLACSLSEPSASAYLPAAHAVHVPTFDAVEY